MDIATKIKILSDNIVVSKFKNCKFKTRPTINQLKCIWCGMESPRFMFSLFMGAGKTLVALYLFQLRKAKKALIISPANVLGHWGAEVRKHTNLTVTIVDGNASIRELLFYKSKSQVIVVSLDWVRLFYKKNIKNINFENRINSFDFAIVDEAHGIKSMVSQGFKFVKNCLSKSVSYLYLMTGTPLANDYTVVFNYYLLLDNGNRFGKYKSSFLSYYFNSFVIKKPKIFFVKYTVKAGRRAELIKKFEELCIVYGEDVNKLPKKLYYSLFVELDTETRGRYKDLLENSTDMSIKFFKMLRICGLFAGKLALLMRVVLAMRSRGLKIVIWHVLRDEGLAIIELLKDADMRFGIYSGLNTNKDKRSVLASWRSGQMDILVANAKSLGMGVDLIEACVSVFFSNSFSYTDRSQAEKRIHRLGQDKVCRFYDIYCNNTLEQVVLNKIEAIRSGVARDFNFPEIRKAVMAAVK